MSLEIIGFPHSVVLFLVFICVCVCYGVVYVYVGGGLCVSTEGI